MSSAFLVPMAFYLSYFFLALPASGILRRTGMKKGMALGLLVMAWAPPCSASSSTMRVYPGALTGLFVIGAGLSHRCRRRPIPISASSVPIDSAAQRIAIMGICNKTAGALAPLVFGALVLSGIGSIWPTR